MCRFIDQLIADETCWVTRFPMWAFRHPRVVGFVAAISGAVAIILTLVDH